MPLTPHVPTAPRARRGRGPAVTAGVLALTLLPLTGAAATGPDVRWATTTATAQTPQVFDDEAGGDADADDPALWVSPTAPADSVLLGTLKNGGLDVYGLDGSRLQHLDVAPTPDGAEEGSRYNNVDVVRGARLGGRVVDLAVVSDRGRDRLRLFEIDPRGAAAGAEVLRDVTAADAAPVFNTTETAVDEQRNAYGLAAGLAPDGGVQVLTTRRNTTEFAVLELVPAADGTVGYRQASRQALPAAFTLPGGSTWAPCEEPGEGPQAEGVVHDAVGGAWFVAQEDVGIWRITVDGDRAASRQLVDTVRGFGVPATYDEDTETCRVTGADPGVSGTHLSADVEGLTLLRGGDGAGYLLASSQGDSTFAAYALEPGPDAPPRYVGGFSVVDGAPAAEGGPAVDGVQHSDGATLTTADLGPAFPHGVFVSHDGEATPTATGEDGSDRVATNFKLVPLERITAPLGLTR
ncbi:3-phytase [Kineococcus radiotolerans]|uniref:3-phytase n=1 Tax=Kineococcus radiotolerans TaxID=131568 RepID=A0A7W4XZ72_KINRA|nr:phytase [Kineococcus radiotolerans]MBB2902989.1 3-phytase [Kineococcus radiotolerans]